jgi:P4 family phage/plasmid primase-like protien
VAGVTETPHGWQEASQPQSITEQARQPGPNGQAQDTGQSPPEDAAKARGPVPGDPGDWTYLAKWKNGALQIGDTLNGWLPASDVHSAIRLRQMFEAAGTPVILSRQTGTWYRWDGSRYRPEKGTFAERQVVLFALNYEQAVTRVCEEIKRRTLIRLGADVAEKDREKATDEELKKAGPHKAYLNHLLSESGQRAVAAQLGRVMAVDDSLLDAGTGEIVTGNGRISYEAILKIRNVELLPHDPARLVTRRTGDGVSYDPAAQCPVFCEFVATSVADVAQRDWLLWRTANALFGRMPRKGFVNLIGERDSGKSTFAALMHRLGGDYVITVQVKTFTVRGSGDSGFLDAELRGARMVFAHEPKPGARYDDGFMKAITGRDHQRTAGKWEKPVEWFPQCTPFIASNQPIRFASSDEAFMDRQEAIRFARGYEKPDPDVLDKMTRELPGILSLLLWYAIREAHNGPPPLPASMVAERERLADETEDALRFVSEQIEEGRLAEQPGLPVSSYVPVQWLFDSYQFWAEHIEREQRTKVLGRKTFSSIVGRRYPTQKSGVYRFTGLVALP